MWASSRMCAAVLLTGCCGYSLAGRVQDIVINEFMASNNSVIQDDQGQYDDWIELHNTSETPVDVGGLYLTDDLTNPTAWQFPLGQSQDTTIDGKGYLLIWADQDTGPELHASFGLSASGEAVGLFAADGITPIDQLVYPKQTQDLSYGRFPDGHGPWRFMAEPSPMAENSEGTLGIVAECQVSFDHGFYDAPISVELTTETPDAEIWYTLDCQVPHQGSGRHDLDLTGARYWGPITLDSTTCLRVIAVKTGWHDSEVGTFTYLFTEDIIHQSPQGQKPGPDWPASGVNGQTINYGMDPDIVNDPRYADLMDDALLAIPSISLVTEARHLFDSKTGIYVNAGRLGRNWERPASAELINPDGTEGFQINAGLRIRGGYSRNDTNPKHAFRLFFRNEYGDAKLTYPLFGDEGVDEFDNIDLRTSQNYSWSYGGDSRNTMVREVFSRDAQRDMGHPYTRSRYYHLYLNGHYWGLFQTQERSEASYGESYFGGAKEDYDVIKSTGGNPGYTIEATDGTLDAWQRLWDMARAGFNDERYYKAQGLNPDGTVNPDYERLLDLDNLIDYMLCVFYVGDFDSPVSGFLGNQVPNNFYAIYNRENPDGFKCFRHDAEHSLLPSDARNYDRTGPYPAGQQFQHFNPQWLHQQLVAHPDYVWRFANRTYKHFFNDGVFTPEQSQQRILARAEQIEMAIIAESARWGDSKRSSPFTKDNHWWPEINMLVNEYLPNRTDTVFGQLVNKGWYPGIDPPKFFIDGHEQHSGTVPLDARLSMLNPNGSGEIYYSMDGADPRFAEIIGPATQILVGLESPRRYLIPLSDIGQTWQTRDFDDSQWTEVHGGLGYDWTEEYAKYYNTDLMDTMWGINASCLIRIPFHLDDPSAVDRLQLRMQYDDGFAAYLNGVRVAEDSAPEALQWNANATQAHNAQDHMTAFTLASAQDLLKAGENLLAIHGLNASFNSTDFLVRAELVSVEGPARESGLYRGPLTLMRTTRVKACVLRNDQWSALHDTLYSVGPVAKTLRISEVMYHPENGNEEFVELVNIGQDPINLNFVRFTNGIDFTFGDLTLSPSQTVLIVRDLAAFEAAYGTQLNVAGQYEKNLNNGGDRLELQNALGQTILDFRYEDDWYPATDGSGYSLEVSDVWTAEPSQFSEFTTWRQSVHADGSPGTVD